MKVVLIAASLLIGTVLTAPNNKQEPITYRNLYKDPVNNAPVPDSHKPSGRIINGQIAEPNSIPFQAFLEVSGLTSSAWYCGGSLISTKVILTAGHCGFEATEAKITLGAQRPMENEDTQIVVKSNDIVVHEGFDMERILNDIALIRLKYPVQYTSAIQSVPLPPDNNKLYVGELGKVSGWGLTDGMSNQLSAELRYTTNDIISNIDCKQFFGDIPDYQVCMSGTGGRSSCNGDSGGPLTVNGVQIGVVSYGVNYCIKEFPSAFTRTSSFLDWIAKNSSPS